MKVDTVQRGSSFGWTFRAVAQGDEVTMSRKSTQSKQLASRAPNPRKSSDRTDPKFTTQIKKRQPKRTVPVGLPLVGSEVLEARVAFRPDPALGDAGAELAGDFGRDFLIAATSGEDISEIENASTTEPSEVGEPFLHIVSADGLAADGLEDLTDYAELEEDPFHEDQFRLDLE
jgi:hypothetical protein